MILSMSAIGFAFGSAAGAVLSAVGATTMQAMTPPQPVTVVRAAPPQPSLKPTAPQIVSKANPEIWCSTWASVPGDCGLMTPMMFLPGALGPNQATPIGSSAADLARRSQSVPVGRAAIQWWRYSNSLFAPTGTTWTPDRSGAAPHPWDSRAVDAVSTEWSAWLREYKAAGGRLDLLVGDCERWSIFTNWGMSQSSIQRIATDARVNTPMFGVASLRSMLGTTSIEKVNSPQLTDDYLKWNHAIGTLTAGAMREAVWSPAVAQYPALKGSNYSGIMMTDRPAPDLNGHAQPHSNIVGTAASPVAYGQIECASTAWYIHPQDPTRLAKFGTKRIERNAWFSFLMDQQTGRACKRSDPSRPLHPWIAMTVWTGDKPGTVGYAADPRYHDEMVRHYALLGTEVFLFWNPESATVGTGVVWTTADRDRAARRLNSVLADVNLRTRGLVKLPVTTDPVAFDSPVVTSGAQRMDGRWVWRTTVRHDVTAIRDARTGARVALDASGVGRWDVTETSNVPRFTADLAGQASIASASGK